MIKHNLITEMTAYYDRRVPWHDQYMSYTSNAAMESSLAPIISLIEPDIRDKDVLEIACGTGNWTQVLARRAHSVLATDACASAIASAKGKLLSPDNITFEVVDAYALESIDRSFDIVFAADWWSHVPKSSLPEFLQGVNHLLGAGGKAIFIDMTMIDYFAQEEAYIDDEGNRISTRTLPDGSRFRVVKNFPTEVDLRQVLTPFAADVLYSEHHDLHRWLLTYTRR